MEINRMEKRSRTYDLDGIKDAFKSVADLRMTRTARRTSAELGLSLENVVFIIQSLTYQNFYKSMTTYADHRVWQDVYNFQLNDLDLYIKFMMDNEGHLIVSFKQR
jgi:motility quorum-sensing regulator/GCU-specific mRNA interferase toxin